MPSLSDLLNLVHDESDDTLRVKIISGGGSGTPNTEYTEGEIDATPTGIVPMWRNSADDSLKSTSDENPLPVAASIDPAGLATETKQDDVIDRLGEVQTSPTANTLLARLKTIAEQQLAANHQVQVSNFPATQPISAASLPLPTGAATSAKQDTGNLSLSTIATKTTALEAKDFATQTTLAALLAELEGKADLTETQPVSASSLPLPSGAATSANQSTGNSSLASIKTAVEKIDNQEDEILFETAAKATSDDSIVAAPGSGHHLRIHHISVNNHGENFTKFKIRDGSGGDIIRDYGLAAEGGAIAENFKRPIGLSSNTALYYDYESGTSADISITVHYEDITD